MTSTDIFVQILLRLLPSVVLFALAFLAIADKRTREQWATLLYQMGSIRPDQREDPNIQRGVRTPFIVLAVILLFWPAYYYYYITRPTEVKATVYLTSPAPPASNSTSNSATGNTASATPGGASIYGTPVPSAATSAPSIYGSSAPGGQPAATSAPKKRTNIYGTPLAP